MPDLRLLKSDWSGSLSQLLQSARDEFVISSPYVTGDGIAFLLDNISSSFRYNGKLVFLTNLAPINLIQGVTDPDALQQLATQVYQTVIYHLPRLHAKAYISDTQKAIITSGNLTLGGLRHNYEYGVLLTDPQTISRIYADITEYAQLGAKIS